MDKLTKEQKDEYATAFAILALYDGGVSSFVVAIYLSLLALHWNWSFYLASLRLISRDFLLRVPLNE